MLTLTLLGIVMVLPIYEDWKSHGSDTTGDRPALLVIGILITAPVAWCVAWLARYATWRAFEPLVQRSRAELTHLKTELRAVISSGHIRPTTRTDLQAGTGPDAEADPSTPGYVRLRDAVPPGPVRGPTPASRSESAGP